MKGRILLSHQQALATRFRPLSLNEVVGQDHLIGPEKILTRMVESGRITSIILYGPPGIGKTSIATALSNDLNFPFGYFNAGVHTKKELQDLTKKATPKEPVVVLLDEVHRLDKPKQDYLLMMIEDGSVIMVGATTENPYISINPALRSRSHIFELKAVTQDAIVQRLLEALGDMERGLGNYRTYIALEELEYLASQTNGDLRAALNILELAVVSTDPNPNGEIEITRDILTTCLQQRQIGGDKDGDEHYNLLSALQKSIRGSDTDATLHYLARLIQGGDLISIVRRFLVIAYEDIGLADPTIGPETLAAVTTAERVGFPEARIPLAQIAVRMALSPKSNVAYKALDEAIAQLNGNRDLSIPSHLKDAHYKGAAKLGNGVGYQYPHDFPYGITQQQYLPDAYQYDRYLQFRDETDIPDIQKRYQNINGAVKGQS